MSGHGMGCRRERILPANSATPTSAWVDRDGAVIAVEDCLRKLGKPQHELGRSHTAERMHETAAGFFGVLFRVRIQTAMWVLVARVLVVAGVFGIGAACGGCGRGESEPSDEAQLRRLFAVLDYVGTDYGPTVADGRVVNDSEYQEQVGFAASAGEILGELRDPPEDLRRLVGEVQSAIGDKASAERVASLTRDARHAVIEHYGLVQSPATAPSREKGAQLFVANCAACHGERGVPPDEKLRELKPPPRTLSDREVLASLSPHRVFNALTLGVSGTAMPRFDGLPVADRWDLAFYVFTLRAGARAGADDLPPESRVSLQTLATSKDAELRRQLAERDDPAHAEAALDAMRTIAPYRDVAARAPLVVARGLVEESEDLVRRGRKAEAASKLLDAYFTGFEPVEGTLRAVDPGLVADAESEFQRLRRAAADGDVAATTEGASRLQRLLNRAEARLDEGASGDTWFGAVAGALIVLREGAEAALLVLLLLAGVAHSDRRDAARAVHAGWIAALVLGVVAFFGVRAVTERLAVSSEIIEAVASLLAAAILFFVSHWMIGRAQAARWSSFIKQRVGLHLSQGRLWALAGLAFLAVFREAVETVLFFEGLLASGPSPVHVLVGAIAGGLLLAASVVALRRLGNRLPLRTFFSVSSALLYAMCVVFAGHGTYALVSAGVLSPHPIPVPAAPLIGFHPDLSPIVAQGLLVIAVAVSVARQRRDARAASIETQPTESEKETVS